MNDVEFFNSFRIKFFEFLHAQTHTYRSTPYHYIIYVYEGNAHFICDHADLAIGPGDFLYMPIGLNYHSSWNNLTNTCFLSLGFTHLPYQEKVRYGMQRIPSSPETHRLAERLREEMNVNCTTVGLIYQLFGELQKDMVGATETRKTVLVDMAEHYWQQNPFATAQDTAKHCGVSESSLYAAFRAARSCTPVEAKRKQLCSTAVELLLSTDKSIEEISGQLGFSSAVYFRKVFREEMSMSPRDVRRNRLKPGLINLESLRFKE